MIDDGTLN